MNNIATFYINRHLTTEMQKKGKGSIGTKLVPGNEKFQESLKGQYRYIQERFYGIDLIVSGGLDRHRGTIGLMSDFFRGPIIIYEGLDAFHSWVFEEDRDPEKELGLDRFVPDADGLCRIMLDNGRTYEFDPAARGVNPFNMYSGLLFDEELSNAVLGEDRPKADLPSFDEFRKKASAVNSYLVQIAVSINNGEKLDVPASEFYSGSPGDLMKVSERTANMLWKMPNPIFEMLRDLDETTPANSAVYKRVHHYLKRKSLKIGVIASCSTIGLMTEHAMYGDVGKHMYDMQPAGKPLYPMGNGDVVVYELDRKNELFVVQTPISREKYLENAQEEAKV